MQNKKMQNKNPTVSVLTTVYNREKYIAACIESVLASTYKDWELIIVDDQSKDRSVAIAQEYAARDARIKVYVNEKNLGDYPNRNQAASYAKGKYLKYLDADDLIYPHGLRLMAETMEQFPECALGISQEVAEDFKPFPFVMQPKETFTREFLMRGVLGIGPTATIIRRDAFEALGGFTGTRYIGDTELWYKIALKYPIVKMVDGLIFWRQHDDQQIVSEQKDTTIVGFRYLHQIKTLENPLIPLSPEAINTAKMKIDKRFARQLLQLVKQGRFKTANQIRKSCNLSWLMIFKSI